MNTVHKLFILFIAVILAALSVPVFGQSMWKHPVVNMQAENMTGLRDDSSGLFHLLFMKKDWLGFGIGLGGSSCEINDGVLKSGHIQVLEDDDNEIDCFNLEGCVLISPHIARIGKVDCFFDAQPSVRLQSQSSIKYGYVTPDGTPRVEKYKGNLIALQRPGRPRLQNIGGVCGPGLQGVKRIRREAQSQARQRRNTHHQARPLTRDILDGGSEAIGKEIYFCGTPGASASRSRQAPHGQPRQYSDN